MYDKENSYGSGSGRTPEEERKLSSQQENTAPRGETPASPWRESAAGAAGNSSVGGGQPGPDGSYHYVRPEWSRSAPEQPRTEPVYGAGQTRQSDGGSVPPTPPVPPVPPVHEAGPAPESGKKKTRRGPGWAAVVAMCLCCALLGGAVGGVLAGSVSGGGAAAATETPQLSVAPSGSGSGTTTSTTTGDTMSADAIYDMACEQVVGVTTEMTYTNWFGQTSSSAVTGSGFIISQDGYILTNYHVIEDAVQGGYDISVMLHDGTEYVATVVGTEADNDVAVLKIDATGLNPVTLGNSDDIRVGDTVYAVGNPLGELAYTMTTGSVTALDRAITTEDYTVPVNMFQLDAAVNSGNSGGPVYNTKGEVIGIVTAKNGGSGVEGLGFAIPINDAVTIANDLIAHGYVTGKAYMGVTGYTVDSSAAQYYNLAQGVFLDTVTEGSAAEAAGLQHGDIITKLGDTAITTWEELNAAVRQYKAGDTVTVTYSRNGQTLTTELTFAERPADDETQIQSDQSQDQSQSQGQQQSGNPQFVFPDLGSIFGN
jgi:serine protease Do